MGRTRKGANSSPAVKTAKSVKRKYGTGSMSPGKCLRVRRALIDVEAKTCSLRQAAKNVSVSTSYLRRRLSGEVALDSRNGPQPVFNRQEEEAMARWLKEMAERGMGLKPGEFLDFVQGVVQKEKRSTPFVNDRPSYQWYQSFMQRNVHIVQIRKEAPLELSRSKLTREAMDQWYSKFRDFLVEHGLLHKPQCIYNADETNFIMASKAGKVIGPARNNQNTPVPHVSGGPSKQRLTVMFCGCADGSMIPPFMVFPDPKPRGYNVLTGGIVGSDVAFTKKGWMDSSTYELFLKHFSNHASKDRPVVLLVDSVSSHISMSAFENAEENGVLLYRLVPNATHLMQPLDKGVFGPLKRKWYDIARAHSRDHPGVPIGKASFAEKLKEAYHLFYKPLILINSFKASGIYPVDSTVIKDSDLKPGMTFSHEETEGTESETQKVTKFSNKQIEAQGALRALDTALSTPTRQRYEQRIDEGYDIVGQSPCFDVYRKLRAASEGQVSPTATATAPAEVNRSTPVATVTAPSGLDVLASVAIQQDDDRPHPQQDDDRPHPQQDDDRPHPQQDDDRPHPLVSDVVTESSHVLSPVLVESMVMPKSAKPKKMQPRRLVHTLPHHLTSAESVRTMALREVAKIKTFAQKEMRAKQKFLKSVQPKPTSSKRKKKVDSVKRSDTLETEDSDEENVTCLGCGCSWKEDQELGLGRTWVKCDSCINWLHTECCSQEIDSEEPFSCPDCTK